MVFFAAAIMSSCPALPEPMGIHLFYPSEKLMDAGAGLLYPAISISFRYGR
jgi:hypothetical protein